MRGTIYLRPDLHPNAASIYHAISVKLCTEPHFAQLSHDGDPCQPTCMVSPNKKLGFVPSRRAASCCKAANRSTECENMGGIPARVLQGADVCSSDETSDLCYSAAAACGSTK